MTKTRQQKQLSFSRSGLIKNRSLLLFITIFLYAPNSHAWGSFGHELITKHATRFVLEETLKNCGVTREELTQHTTDPDKIWRNSPVRFPHEGAAHFFHVQNQPKDWRKRTSAKDRKEGVLVYRITNWFERAKKERKNKNFKKLKTSLYGLTHYLADLTQPLHLNPDYDGKNAGVPGLHKQFETKMVYRFQDKIDQSIKSNLKKESVPALWQKMKFRTLIFNIAEQTNAKAPFLLKESRHALVVQKKHRKPRFNKKILWKKTGNLAKTQMTLASRLIIHTLNLLCR